MEEKATRGPPTTVSFHPPRSSRTLLDKLNVARLRSFPLVNMSTLAMHLTQGSSQQLACLHPSTLSRNSVICLCCSLLSRRSCPVCPVCPSPCLPTLVLSAHPCPFAHLTHVARFGALCCCCCCCCFRWLLLVVALVTLFVHFWPDCRHGFILDDNDNPCLFASIPPVSTSPPSMDSPSNYPLAQL